MTGVTTSTNGEMIILTIAFLPESFSNESVYVKQSINAMLE